MHVALAAAASGRGVSAQRGAVVAMRCDRCMALNALLCTERGAVVAMHCYRCMTLNALLCTERGAVECSAFKSRTWPLRYRQSASIAVIG